MKRPLLAKDDTASLQAIYLTPPLVLEEKNHHGLVQLLFPKVTNRQS